MTTNSTRLGYPDLGFGVGLRAQHFEYVLEHQPPVDWFEIISENFMESEGWPRYVLDQVAERYQVVMHGVSLSIGSTDPLDFEYLATLKRLADRVQAVWLSDHLCWTGVNDQNTHELLPLPLNEESLMHVIERMHVVQDFLEQPVMLENPSSYLTFKDDCIPEYEFLSTVCDETGCGLLLDVNNVYVSSYNHGFDPEAYLDAIPAERIVQFHLAGHKNLGTHIIDTHDRQVTDRVWELYHRIFQRTEGVSTLLEWDSNIPEFPELHKEVLKAARYLAGEMVLGENTQAEDAGRESYLSGAHPPAHPVGVGG